MSDLTALAETWENEADEIDVGPRDDPVTWAAAKTLRECAADPRRALAAGEAASPREAGTV